MANKYIIASTAAEIISKRTGIPLHELVDIMVEVPAADVVEVVRCKDCKYACINSFSAASGIVACKFLADKSDGIFYAMQQDDFCRYGERKEGLI